MTVTRRLRIEEQLQTAETDTTKVLTPDGTGGVEWSTGGGSGGDCDHRHAHARFVAAGGSPETFALIPTPLFDEVMVTLNGAVVDPDDVTLSGGFVSLDTAGGDIVVAWYPTSCEDDMTTRLDVSVDFSDVPSDTNTKVLYTPTAGDYVQIAIRTDTWVPISGGGISGSSEFIAFGRAADATNFQAYLGTDVISSNTADSFGAAGQGDHLIAGDFSYVAGEYCPDTTPIRAFANYGGAGPATAGHADLILLITRAP